MSRRKKIDWYKVGETADALMCAVGVALGILGIGLWVQYISMQGN